MTAYIYNMPDVSDAGITTPGTVPSWDSPRDQGTGKWKKVVAYELS